MASRIEMLAELLAQHPNDAFARYGLAMEHSNAGNVAGALEEFGTLLKLHPDYVSGYFMAAQTLAKAGRSEEAVGFLERGIAAAVRSGDGHAQGEMEALLHELKGE